MIPSEPLMPLLMLVTNRHVVSSRHKLLRNIEAAVRGGVDIVQVRENDLPESEIRELCKDIKTIANGNSLVIINDRTDIAVSSSLDGVHLTEKSVSPEVAKRILGSQAFVSGSCHSLGKALELFSKGINSLVVGTMFETESHPGKIPEGPELVAEIRSHVNCPIIGIGGITISNIPKVLNAGATGIAVIREILCSADPESVARELKMKLNEAVTRIND